MPKNSFIFHDVRGSRWRRFKFLAGLGAFIGITALVLFVQAMLVSPKFDQPNSLQNLKKQIKTYQKLRGKTEQSESDKALSRQLARKTPATASRGPASSVPKPGIRAAFFSGGDEAVFHSLALNQSLLTHICPDWLSFATPEEGIKEDEDAGLERIPAS